MFKQRKNLTVSFAIAVSMSLAATLPLMAQTVAVSSPVPAKDSSASATAGSATEKLPTIKFEKYKLKNGLEVILSEDHKLPLVGVNLWYHVGPANEKPGRTGFAHLFEHMMFEGSEHVGAKAHFKHLEAAGASDINGTTDFDRTNYFETLPSNQLELALWLESDRMGYLLNTLDREKLANQRDVVRNERRQSIENAPYGIVEEGLFHELFPKGHPYYASVIGSHADVEAARLADVREFFKQYYTPNNASIAIVGDFDPAVAKKLIDKYFGSIPAGPPVPKIEVKTPEITAQKRVTITDQVELPRVMIDWLTPPIYTAGDAEGDIVSHILGGGKSSRLYKKLVYEKQIAQNVSASNSSLMLGSVFGISATAKPNVKPEELEKAINEELAEFLKNGPTQKEVDGARNSIQAGTIRSLETIGGVANRLNNYNHFLGDPGYLPKDIERYNKVTVADCKAFANKYLKPQANVVVYGVPGKKVLDDVPQTNAEQDKEEAAVKVTGTAPEEAWRATAPKAGPAPKLELPVPVSFKLDNGLTVYLVERHLLPIVAANLVVLNGSDANPVDKPGLSSFTSDMMDEGTTTRPTLQIADDLNQIGAHVRAGSSSDSAYVAMNTLTKTLDNAMEIFSDVALHPSFEQKEIDRIRNQRITGLKQEKDDPNTVSRRVMYKVLYGPNHPYGFDEAGTIDSNKNISRENMQKFFQEGYAPQNSALIFAGDLTLDQAKALAQKYFGSWKGTAPKRPDLTVKSSPKRAIYLVNKDGAPQTFVRLAGIGLERSNPDYVPAQISNNALGGMFSSRLNMDLREKHGYTYGAFSRFTFRREPGPFTCAAAIRTNVTAPAVKEFISQIESMQTSPVTPEELKMAKDNLSLSIPGNFESTPELASTTGELFIYGLPKDYFHSLPGKIDAVTGADVERVAKKYMKSPEMVIITVGDKEKIKGELEKLNLGPVEELDVEANPVSNASAADKK
ncbi:MAG: insulinase family protein [Candidatus Obscuribacterales bacterium]|jgi:zinc protease|nr:insulinase family protein [Candidatus Obscuribacterales bacterium]